MRAIATMGLCLALAVVAPAFAEDAADAAASDGAYGAVAASSTTSNSSGVGSNDPWEKFNRKIFWFNEKVDIWLFRPVAVAWDFVLPDLVQTGIQNIFSNARFPIIFVNDLLQAKPLEAGEDLGRFLVNTTVGIGGVWDPASRIGLPGNNEDFGQTLGYWGVPAGPYLVLPLLGASNPRDTVGIAADSATMVYPYFVAWYVSAAITTTRLINTRARYIDEIDENRASALDFYALQRNAYSTYRENLVNDYQAPGESKGSGGEDLYYFEDEEDDFETGESERSDEEDQIFQEEENAQ